MASSLDDIRKGIKDRLELSTGPALRDVHLRPTHSGAITATPTAVIILDSVQVTTVAMGGTPMEALFRILLYVANAESEPGFLDLDEYVDPQGTRSIDKALADAPNIGLSDVTVELIRVENVGLRENNLHGADFVVRALRVG